MTSRLVNLADVVEVFTGRRDRRLRSMSRVSRSGTQFDPALVDVFCAEAPELFADLDAADELERRDGGR